MSKVFYLHEILKFAVEKEKEAYELYKFYNEKEENETTKNIFATLMNEELKHEETYSDILKSISSEQTPTVEENTEYDAYMKQLINDSRTQDAKKPDSFQSISEAIAFAISREKDSILFYVGLKNYLPQKDQSAIEGIIKEEGRHIIKLLDLQKTI